MKPNEDMGHGKPPTTKSVPIQKTNERRIQEGRDVLFQLVKAVKTLSIYAHNQDQVDLFVKSAHSVLTSFLTANKVFPLVLQGGSIKFLGEEIYSEDAGQLSFAYKFYRDGIRKLIFLKGLTLKEVHGFVKIAAMCSQGAVTTSIDIVSLLWKGSYSHLEYTVIEGLSPLLGSIGMDEKSIEQEVDKVVDKISLKLMSGGEVSPDLKNSFAAGSQGGIKINPTAMTADVPGEIKGISLLGELAGQAELVPADVKEMAEKVLDTEGKNPIFSELVEIVTLIVRYGFDERELEDIAENVLLAMDMFLEKENFSDIAGLYKKLDELAGSSEAPAGHRERFRQLRIKIAAGFGTEARMERIRIILCGAPVKDAEGLATVLRNVDDKAFKRLPEMVEHIPIQENVTAVCRAFHHPRPGLDYVAKHLIRSLNSNIIIEGLKAASLVDFEGKGEMLAALLSHPDRGIRFGAIKAVATTPSEEGRQAIAKALEDKDREVMLVALDAVHRSDPAWAGRTLVRLIKHDSFRILPSDIQTRFYRAAAFTGSSEAMDMFGEMMSRKGGLFHKKEVRRVKLKVIDALRSEPSLVTYKTLETYCNDEKIPPDIRERCRDAMQDVRKAMVGG